MSKLNGKTKVLFFCSWPIADGGKGSIDFVYDQIKFIAPHIDAYFIKITFVNFLEWIKLKISKKTFQPYNKLWPSSLVKTYEIYCPRISPLITRRTYLEDIEDSGNSISKIIENKIGKIDIIHTHVVLPLGLLSSKIAINLKTPLIIQEHSGPFEMHLNTPEKEKFVKATLNRASLILPVGQDLSKRISLVVEEKNKVIVLPNLVRTDLFKATPIPDIQGCIKILIVSHAQPVKGMPIFISAVDILIKEGFQVEATVIGDASSDLGLIEQIQKLNLERHIILHHRMKKMQLIKFYQETHIYVCSSHTETFGLAPAEAIATGRPVVTTKCGGPDNFVNSDCGEIVEAGNPASIAEGIIKVWNKLNNYDHLKMHNYIHEEYGPSAFNKRIFSIYNNITSHGN